MFFGSLSHLTNLCICNVAVSDCTELSTTIWSSLQWQNIHIHFHQNLWNDSETKTYGLALFMHTHSYVFYEQASIKLRIKCDACFPNDKLCNHITLHHCPYWQLQLVSCKVLHEGLLIVPVFLPWFYMCNFSCKKAYLFLTSKLFTLIFVHLDPCQKQCLWKKLLLSKLSVWQRRGPLLKEMMI